MICAYRVRADGASAPVTWRELDGLEIPADEFLWLHLDRQATDAQAWIQHSSGLDPIDAETLLADETRPRFSLFETSALLNLRGINFNPGEAEEDMVSIRLWIEPNRVISTRRRQLRAVDDVRQIIEKGHRIRSSTGLVALLADGLVERIGPVIDELDNQLDTLEDRVAKGADLSVRNKLRQLRRRAVILRRFISPQRDALTQFANADVDWLPERPRRRLQEVANDITRHVEALSAVWERAAILQDEVTAGLAEQANRRLYILSIVAAIFLPLGFIVGLLGVNLAGIPGAERPFAFLALCIGLGVMSGVLIWLFRLLKWF